MYDSAESSSLQQSSLSWALWGNLIGVATLGGLGWLQLHNPLISDALMVLLGVGCIPAALALGVAVWRGCEADESTLDSSSHSKPWGMRLGLVGLVMLPIGVSVFLWDLQRRDDLRARWVEESRAVVSRWLAESDGLPAEYRHHYGEFQALTLDSFREGVFKGAGKYLAHCTARYEHKVVPVKMTVYGDDKNDSSSQIEILRPGRQTIKGREGLGVNVSHPDLRRL